MSVDDQHRVPLVKACSHDWFICQTFLQATSRDVISKQNICQSMGNGEVANICANAPFRAMWQISESNKRLTDMPVVYKNVRSVKE